MTESCASPRLASLSEARKYYLRGFYDRTWPPPGTIVLPITGGAVSWGVVCGELDQLPAGHKYATTLDRFVLDLPPIAASILLRAAGLLSGQPVLASVISAVGHWPVIYEVGRGIEDMEWQRITFRGTLGSVEQFQHKFDFRIVSPSAYPSDDSQLLGSANFFRGLWNTALVFADGVSNGALLGRLGGTVAYTEVGAVVLTQAAAGGLPTQDMATAWSAWPTTGRPSGGGITALPNEVATCVTLQSETRGPRGRGRTYLPPFGVLQMANDGTYLDAAVAAAGRCINSFLSQVIADGAYVPVVVSLAGGASHEITSASIGKVPDSQRRRRRSQIEANATVWSN